MVFATVSNHIKVQLMNWVDLLLFILILLSAWGGWRKGFLHATSDLIIWIGSMLLAFLCYGFVAEGAAKLFSPSVWWTPLSFLFCLLVSGALLSWLARLVFARLPRSYFSSKLNHAFGILPGIINGVIWATVVALLLLTLPFTNGLTAEAQNSKVAEKLAGPADWIEEKLSPVFNEPVKKSMTKLMVEPGSEKTIKLPFATENVKERPDLEAEMLVLVNEERIQEGLKPLVADTAMRKVAIAHSKDMFARGYFSHDSPEKKTPFDRIKEARIRFFIAGENLAYAHSLKIAHQGLMNSPGHRANILKPQYGRVGIGVVDGGIRGLMISQEFRN
jgi:uncharacterized protein YkwD